MLKRLTTILLAISLFVGALFVSPLEVNAASTMKMSDSGLGILKQMEGFAKYPYYDYSQYTVGYGTYCPQADLERYQRDGITEQEAEALLRNYLVNMENGINKFIDKYGLSLSQNQFDSLALFTYNCGSSWMYNDTGIRKAVVEGYTGNEFIYEMSRWCTAGGSILSGLVKRRLAEANIYLNNVYSNTWPSDCRYVRYNGNGGTIGAKVQGFDIDEPINVKGTATRSGYTFLGWFTAATGGGQIKTLDSSVVNNTILYAQWKDNSIVETPTIPEEPVETPITPEVPENNPNVLKGTVYNCYSLRVRSGAGKDTTTVAYLSAGDVVEILEQKTVGDTTWGRISKGWVSMNCIQLEEVPAPPVEEKEETPVEVPTQPETPKEEVTQPTHTVQKGKIANCWSLNVRADAGKSNKIVGFYVVGADVSIYETKIAEGKTWGRCDKGWISLDYVKLNETGTPNPSTTTNTSTGTQSVKTGTIINCSSLTIRKGPGKSNAATGYYKNGIKVNIYETKEVDGKTWGRTEKGWISLSYVQLGDFKTFTGTVTVNGLRIRQNPSLSAKIMSSLNKGAKEVITEVKSADGMQWGKISRGWISLNYVSY